MDSSGSASEEPSATEVTGGQNGANDINNVQYAADNNTGLYKCHLCPYITPYKGSLKSHFAVHSTVRPFKCDMCDYEAKRLYDLKKHKIFKHGKKNLVTRRMKRGPGTNGKQMKDRRKSIPYKSVIDMPVVSIHQPLTIPCTGDSGPVFPEPVAVSNCDMNNGENGIVNVKAEPSWEQGKLKSEDEGILDMRMSRKPKMEAGNSDESVLNIASDQKYGYEEPVTHDSMHGTTDGYMDGHTGYVDYQRHYAEARDASLSPESRRDSVTNRERTSSGSSSASMILSLLQRTRSSLSGSQDLPYPSLGSGGFTPKQSPHENTPPLSSVVLRPPLTTLDLSKSGPRQLFSGGEESADESSGSSAHNVPSSSSSRAVGTTSRRAWHCSHCDILFFDSAIYFIHVGLHNRKDPWECNLCGDKCHDVYSFSSHFVNEHKCK